MRGTTPLTQITATNCGVETMIECAHVSWRFNRNIWDSSEDWRCDVMWACQFRSRRLSSEEYSHVSSISPPQNDQFSKALIETILTYVKQPKLRVPTYYNRFNYSSLLRNMSSKTILVDMVHDWQLHSIDLNHLAPQLGIGFLHAGIAALIERGISRCLGGLYCLRAMLLLVMTCLLRHRSAWKMKQIGCCCAN